MKRLRELRQIIALLSLMVLLTLGLLVSIPEKAIAFPELSKDGTCTECHAPGEHDAPGGGEPKNGEKEPAQPVQSVFVPEPFEPVVREVNNTLLGSGLGFAIILIGGAIALDKRRK